MKGLVLGGTGAMGSHLVEILSNAGIITVVTTRKYRPSRNNIKYLQGNAHEMDFLYTILEERWDAIIDFMVYSTEEFKARIELLLSATAHYIFLSSSRVYADSKLPITEESSRLLDVSKDFSKCLCVTNDFKYPSCHIMAISQSCISRRNII